MSSKRSSEFEIFTDSQFFNKKFGNREYSEDLLLLIVHSVSMHLLLAARCVVITWTKCRLTTEPGPELRRRQVRLRIPNRRNRGGYQLYPATKEKTGG